MMIINYVIYCYYYFEICRNLYITNGDKNNNIYNTYWAKNNLSDYRSNISSIEIKYNIYRESRNFFHFGSLCGINSKNLTNLSITNTNIKGVLGNIFDFENCKNICCLSKDKCDWCNISLLNIETMNFSNNQLTNKFVLNSLPNLKRLDISNNKISILSMSELPKLDIIICNNNNIFRLNFNEMFNIRTIYLFDNRNNNEICNKTIINTKIIC